MGERFAAIVGAVAGIILASYLAIYRPMMENYRDHSSVFLSTSTEERE